MFYILKKEFEEEKSRCTQLKEEIEERAKNSFDLEEIISELSEEKKTITVNLEVAQTSLTLLEKELEEANQKLVLYFLK